MLWNTANASLSALLEASVGQWSSHWHAPGTPLACTSSRRAVSEGKQWYLHCLQSAPQVAEECSKGILQSNERARTAIASKEWVPCCFRHKTQSRVQHIRSDCCTRSSSLAQVTPEEESVSALHISVLTTAFLWAVGWWDSVPGLCVLAYTTWMTGYPFLNRGKGTLPWLYATLLD